MSEAREKNVKIIAICPKCERFIELSTPSAEWMCYHAPKIIQPYLNKEGEPVGVLEPQNIRCKVVEVRSHEPR